MTNPKQHFFTDTQVQQLILAYLYNCADSTPMEDVHRFLNACIGAVSLGESVKMAADGLLLIDWSPATGKFSFGLTQLGESIAKTGEQ